VIVFLALVGSVVLDVTMSLDSFITGPKVGVELPLGEGGDRLHDWMANSDPEQGGAWHQTAASGMDAKVKQDVFATTGAAAAGSRNVCLIGADIARQRLSAGLLDELHLHLAPMTVPCSMDQSLPPACARPPRRHPR
jgi:hypothetical protein